MLRAGARCGLTPAQVWDMTPRELFEYRTGFYDAQNKRMKWSREDAIFAGYYAAGLRRTHPKQPFPTLKKLLDSVFPERRRKVQSPEQILSALRGIVAAFGGTDKTKGKF